MTTMKGSACFMKKILTLFVSALIILHVISVNAAENAVLPVFDVTFNSQRVKSNYRQFPLLVYKDITYVPMTYYDCRYLGLSTQWDNDTKTLYIQKGTVTSAYHDYNWQWKNKKNNEVFVCDFNIVVNGKKIDNSKEEYPLLTFRDVTYFPLTWRFAVDEFGWEYDFDSDKGLFITSENYHIEAINLPYITADAATDGDFYYYSGEKDGKMVVYRSPVSDTTKPVVIHEQFESPLTRPASFVKSGTDIYITYFAGYSAVTGSQRYFKISADGSVTEKMPEEKYSYSKHGSSGFWIFADGIKVIGTHEYFDGPTKLAYEIEGKMYEADALSENVRVGRKRNGKFLYCTFADCVKIVNGKIYYSATILDKEEDSALYCIDTKTGENKKILDGVCGFYVYNDSIDGTMILFDNDGYLMMWREADGNIKEIEAESWKEKGLILEDATGNGKSIYTVQKTIGGDKTVVKNFIHRDGGILMSEKLFETKTGTVLSKSDDKLCLRIDGEAPEDEIRLLVMGNDITPFYSSDIAESVFIFENTLLYKIDKDKALQVDLK